MVEEFAGSAGSELGLRSRFQGKKLEREWNIFAFSKKTSCVWFDLTVEYLCALFR